MSDKHPPPPADAPPTRRRSQSTRRCSPLSLHCCPQAHQHKRAARAAQHVGPGALEEGAHALLGRHLAPAVQGAVVLALAASLVRGLGRSSCKLVRGRHEESTARAVC